MNYLKRKLQEALSRGEEAQAYAYGGGSLLVTVVIVVLLIILLR